MIIKSLLLDGLIPLLRDILQLFEQLMNLILLAFRLLAALFLFENAKIRQFVGDVFLAQTLGELPPHIAALLDLLFEVLLVVKKFEVVEVVHIPPNLASAQLVDAFFFLALVPENLVEGVLSARVQDLLAEVVPVLLPLDNNLLEIDNLI